MLINNPVFKYQYIRTICHWKLHGSKQAFSGPPGPCRPGRVPESLIIVPLPNNKADPEQTSLGGKRVPSDSGYGGVRMAAPGPRVFQVSTQKVPAPRDPSVLSLLYKSMRPLSPCVSKGLLLGHTHD